MQETMSLRLSHLLPTARRAAGRVLHGPRLPQVTVADFAAQFPDRWHEAFPPQSLPTFAPLRWGDEDAEWSLDPTPFATQGMVDISGSGAIVGLGGGAMTADHRMVWGIGRNVAREVPESSPRRRYPTNRLSGSCLSIASECADTNYGHFVLESLPRLAIARAAGFDLSTFDWIAAGSLPPGIPASLFERAGLDPKRLVSTRMRHRISADRLFATTFPDRPADYPVSSARYLRSLVPDDGAARKRRLFVRRFGYRELTNEAELLAIAAGYGFEPYDYRQQSDPMADFAAAQIVAGSHSATIANIAFCVPGTQVLEIIPTDHVKTYYYTLARAAGHEYHYMLGQSESLRPAGAVEFSQSPVRVDPIVFEAALKELVDRDGSVI